MYDAEELKRLSQQRKTRPTDGERPGPFVTASGRPVRRVYDPSDVGDLDYERDLGQPGDYPFTRGVHATGYRGKPWTMRMFGGFGSDQETHARFTHIVPPGQSALC